MNAVFAPILLDLFDVNSGVSAGANLIQGNWLWMGAGVGLIAATILLIYFVKHIIGNIVGGLIAWAIVSYAFGISLPFAATLIVTILFGMGGVGVMIILTVLGLL